MNFWRSVEIDISSILKAVDEAYGSCKEYQDEGIVVDDCFAIKEQSSFCTKYVAPDKLIYKRMNPSRKETSYEIDGKSCRIVDSDPERNRPSKVPFTNIRIDWNKLDPESVLSCAGGVTFSISDFTLPLLIRNGNRGNWTKSKNFRLMGNRTIDSTECYVIRNVRYPTLLCINSQNFSVKRIEQGPEYLERFSFKSAEMLAKLLATIDSTKTELLEFHEQSNQERICDFFKVNIVT